MDILTEALYYAEALGWEVIPLHSVSDGVLFRCSCRKGTECKSPGKHPRINNWQSQASSDPEQIRQWWKTWPDAGVGVRLGPASGIFDIEFDDAEGEATAEELLSQVKTPSFKSVRSVHYLFSFPDNLKPPKAVVKWRGLEIRFGTDDRGAQSVFPPSRNREWIRSPKSVGLADPPDWLTEAIQGDQKEVQQSDGMSFVMQSSETLEDHPGATEGNRHKTALELVGRWIGTHGANAALLDAAITWARRCSPPFPDSEIIGIVTRLSDKHFAKVFDGTTGKESVNISDNATATRSLIVKPYTEIETESVEWLWQDRIPLGKYSIFAGKPGIGKTFCAMDIAAKVSTGGEFVDGALAPLGDVLIISSEDGAGDTLKPRLEAAGADMSRVFHLCGVDVVKGDDFLDLSKHIPQVERYFEDHPELRLMILDPLTAFLGDIDSHKEGSVRRVLGPVCEVLERHGVAMLGIGHCNKASGAKAIDRVVGSIGFVAAARVAWMFALDPDDEERVLMVPIKNNLARCRTGLSYRIVEELRCSWDSDAVLISADEIDDTDNMTPRDEAKRWLLDKLANGAYPASSIWKDAKGDGIAEKTLKRAKKEVGVVSHKVGDSWVWELPGGEPKPITDFDEWIVE